MNRIKRIKSCDLTRSRLEGNRHYTEDMFCEDLYIFAKSLEENKLVIVYPDFMLGYTCEYISVTAIVSYEGKPLARRFPDMFRTIGYKVPNSSQSVVYSPRNICGYSDNKIINLLHNVLELCVIERIITRSEFYNLISNYVLIH